MAKEISANRVQIPVPFPFNLLPKFFPILERISQPLANRLFIFLFFTPLRFPASKSEMESIKAADTFKLSAAGKTVKVFTWGDGPPVFFTHGWSGRAAQFSKFIEPFTTLGFKVIAFDGPSHGSSSGLQTHVGEFAEVVAVLYQKFGKPVAMIGHSFGGTVNAYSLNNEVQTTKLVLISSPTIAEDVIKQALMKLKSSSKPGKYLRDRIRKKFDLEFEEVSLLHTIKAIKNQRIPIMIVHDENDREISMEHPKALLKIVPDANFLPTTGLGHVRILRDQTVVEEVLEFVKH